MSGKIERANITSTRYTGDVDLPARQNRSFFFIVMESGSTGTLTLGEGNGAIPLASGFHFMPHVIPISRIRVTTTGSCIIAEA